MTAEEKAKELVDKFEKAENDGYIIPTPLLKKCALICVT